MLIETIQIDMVDKMNRSCEGEPSIWTCWRTLAWRSIWEVEYSPWTWLVYSWRCLRCRRSCNRRHTDSVHFEPRGSGRLGELWNYSSVWRRDISSIPLTRSSQTSLISTQQILHPGGVETRWNNTNDKVSQESVINGTESQIKYVIMSYYILGNLGYRVCNYDQH